MTKDHSALESILGVRFRNPDLLRQALVHRSYLNEHSRFPLDHNERLEFLGDAILEFVVTEYLYEHYPNPEGELTNFRASLVNSIQLASIARELEFEDHLYLSRGEMQDATKKARQTILANALEAIIGAIHLDQGLDAVRTFIHVHILSKLDHILKNQLYIDPKSRFQEIAQEKRGATPVYKVLMESGPDHAKQFTIGIWIDDELIAQGQGSSKQEAQEDAAKSALKIQGWN